MFHDREQNRQPHSCDVRLRGFSNRASFEEAVGWVDACGGPLAPEEIGVAEAMDRVVAEAVTSSADVPPVDRATIDGYALRSSETEGTTDYNPVSFTLKPTGLPLRPGDAVLIAAGTALPCGADVILPFDLAEETDARLEVFGSVAAGTGVDRKGQHARIGATLIAAGRKIRPQDLGLLSAAGCERIRVIRRPRVRVVVAGAKELGNHPPLADSDGPMLCGLIARDGGTIESVVTRADRCEVLAKAIVTPGADVILVAGRTGTGPDDEAPVALAEVGELALHGVAVRPGGSVGLGSVGRIPVLLLPGDPIACWCAYELLAGRLIRGLGGGSPEFPHVVREAEVGRKIVSAIGVVDVCRVRFVNERVEPLGSTEFGSLVSSIQADGFVLVPGPLEGYAPGARVTVQLF